MRDITLEELLEAGCHFGHQVTRSNPKARDFIFEAREGIHIIDLAKTKEGLEEAAEFVKSKAQQEGSLIVVVGTKRQAHGIIEEEIKRMKEVIGDEEKSGIFYVTSRWIGGLLTNFSEVSKNFKKLIDLTEKLKDPSEKAKYTKKEVGLWDKERQKLERLYGGVYKLKRKPDLLFVIDSHLEALSVREALAMNVPTVAIVDTNADPHLVDYPIPANDDAVGSIQLIVSYIMDAWKEGRNATQTQNSKLKTQKLETKETIKSSKETKKEMKKTSTQEKAGDKPAEAKKPTTKKEDSQKNS